MDSSNKVIYLNQGHEFWDQTMLKDLLSEVTNMPRQVVVVPGAISEVDEISMELAQYPRVLVIITSDEESKFPIDDLYHPNMIIYSTYYNPKFKNVDYWLPIGYAKHIDQPLADKTVNWFFSGQVTHASRYECIEALNNLGNGVLIETDGFAKGLGHDEYYKSMNQAKVCPAPMGNISPDSFRLVEALELGCVPIPENPDFWKDLFGEVPFPVIKLYEQLPGYITDTLKDYPMINNKVQAWWLRKKREYIYQLRRDCERIGT